MNCNYSHKLLVSLLRPLLWVLCSFILELNSHISSLLTADILRSSDKHNIFLCSMLPQYDFVMCLAFCLLFVLFRKKINGHKEGISEQRMVRMVTIIHFISRF